MPGRWEVVDGAEGAREWTALSRPSGAPFDPAPRRPEVRSFHRGLEGFAPTRLCSHPSLAARLGVAEVWVKDETQRLGLPAFKVLGASWAAHRAVEERRRRGAPCEVLVTATDGNHGRAVARVASILGLRAEVYVPGGTVPERIEAIEHEGARVVVVDGSYDDAVEAAAAGTDPGRVLLADTGDGPAAHDVLDGYSTLTAEIEEQLPVPTGPLVVALQMGCGAFASAVIRHLQLAARPRYVGVEPRSAACVLESLLVGEPLLVPGPHTSQMAGLNCGIPSLAAWDVLEQHLDAVVGIDDTWVAEAMQLLHATGVPAGESGAAGLAGLLALSTTPEAKGVAGLEPDAAVLLVVTEGITDAACTREMLAASV